jgi:hypothetical protein
MGICSPPFSYCIDALPTEIGKEVPCSNQLYRSCHPSEVPYKGFLVPSACLGIENFEG